MELFFFFSLRELADRRERATPRPWFCAPAPASRAVRRRDTTGATIFFVHRQQTQERQVILPRVFALSLLHSQVRFMRTDDAPSRAA